MHSLLETLALATHPDDWKMKSRKGEGRNCLRRDFPFYGKIREVVYGVTESDGAGNVDLAGPRPSALLFSVEKVIDVTETVASRAEPDPSDPTDRPQHGGSTGIM